MCLANVNFGLSSLKIFVSVPRHQKLEMFKFEKILVRTYKHKNHLNSKSLSAKLFSTDKILADTSKSDTDSQQTLHENKSSNIGSANVGDFVRQTSYFQEPKDSKEVTEQSQSFAGLLRHSNFMHMGDPEGKIVVGKIFEVINNDLYIDFGWKFHCVCAKPIKNNSDFVRGAKVRLRIKDLELSTRFLGSSKDITLLEADCVLLGLVSTPNAITKTVEASTTV